MKILFLDVDGVLNSYRNVAAFGGFPWPKGTPMEKANPRNSEKNLDVIAVGMVRQLCTAFDVKIVLHSTWRVHLDAVEFGKRWDLPVIGGTAPGDKAGSITHWLAEHPEVKKYAIIDDNDMQDRAHQCVTTLADGMLTEHFNRLKELLS